MAPTIMATADMVTRTGIKRLDVLAIPCSVVQLVPIAPQHVRVLLLNVCPNCGGGFVSRPVRPAKDWKGGNHLGKRPASTTVKHRPVDPAAHAEFAAPIRNLAPEQR